MIRSANRRSLNATADADDQFLVPRRFLAVAYVWHGFLIFAVRLSLFGRILSVVRRELRNQTKVTETVPQCRAEGD
jgi:hypothetical protein